MPIEPKQPILVVEDDEGMRRAIHRLLTVEGFETVLFDSAEALLTSGEATKARCLAFADEALLQAVARTVTN